MKTTSIVHERDLDNIITRIARAVSAREACVGNRAVRDELHNEMLRLKRLERKIRDALDEQREAFEEWEERNDCSESSDSGDPPEYG